VRLQPCPPLGPAVNASPSLLLKLSFRRLLPAEGARALRSASLSSSVATSQPTTPVEDGKPSISAGLPKRHGLVGEHAACSAADRHSRIMDVLNNRLRDANRIESLLKRKGGESDALDEAAKMHELHMFAQLLRAYKEQPAACSLQICARILPSLRPLLLHRNPEYRGLALDTLDSIINDFGEPIRHALAANASSIGVDLAAEQRHNLCLTCKHALADLYLNSSFILSKLNPSQADSFASLLPLMEAIVDL